MPALPASEHAPAVRRARDPSLDIAKGIGICAVVAGHIYVGWVTWAIYPWHMPLFFLISGLLFRPQPGLAARKFHALLVPYACYLVLLSAPFAAKAVLAHDMAGLATVLLEAAAGGAWLKGWMAVFWFVTCLFFTQLLANQLIPRGRGTVVVSGVCLLLAAYLTQALMPGLRTPLALDVTLFAAPIFLLGHLIRVDGGVRRGFAWWAVAAPLACWAVHAGWIGSIDMKYGRYGTPVLSLAAGLALVSLVLAISRGLVRVPMASRVFQALGAASMTIMFTHFVLQEILAWHLGVTNPLSRVLFALVCGLLLHRLLQAHRLTRRFLLGTA